MRLFKKRERTLSDRQENTAIHIAGRILKAQHKAADYLNGKTTGLSGKTWLMLLILFCAAFGSYCLYLLLQAFY